MNMLDAHRKAVERANAETVEAYSVHGPYTPGNVVHEYWLKAYDYWWKREFFKPTNQT